MRLACALEPCAGAVGHGQEPTACEAVAWDKAVVMCTLVY